MQAFEEKERGFWAYGRETRGGEAAKGGRGEGGREGGRERPASRPLNIHQANVKILIGQFSKHVNHGLDTY